MAAAPGTTIGVIERGSSRPARSAASALSSGKWLVTIAPRSTGRRVEPGSQVASAYEKL